MKISIVGAGVAGLSAARAMLAVGFEVTVYESAVDIGGVWSAQRRYPGISLQSDKQSYAFSSRPMPTDYPQYPSGSQVREYLTAYARAEHLTPLIRFGTKVVEADIDDSGEWRLTLESADGRSAERSDWLIVANGLNSWSHVPAMDGAEDFAAAGGSILTPSDLGDGEALRDRRTVVLGFGKSAADIAVFSATTSATTHMITRTVAWKLPKHIGRLRFQHLLLTRGGEFLLWAPYRTLLGHAARIVSIPVRRTFLRCLERQVVESLELDRRGLHPSTDLTSLTHLTTEGFFEAVDRREIVLHPEATVRALAAPDGRPAVVLSDGTVLDADVVVAATGYDQDIRFFGASARAAMTDADGDLVLDRHTIPRGLEHLAFIGWAESFRSPLGSEIQALWLAAHLSGLTRPIRHRQPPERRYRLTHDSAGRRGLRLTSTGSGFLDLDEWIEEAGFRLPWRVRLAQYFRPLDPSDYAGLLAELVRRIRSVRESAPAHDGLNAVASPTTHVKDVQASGASRG